MVTILDQGRERIFLPYQHDWDGWWSQLVVQPPDVDRSAREQLRKRLAWLGFGALSASTWLAPRDIRQAADRLRTEFPGAGIDAMRMRTDDDAEDRRLLGRCWDLAALNADYSAFLAEHEGLLGRAAALEGESALAARTEIVSTYRHFPFRDPSVPVDLRPDGWLGAEAHGLFLAIHDELAPASVRYVESVIGADGSFVETALIGAPHVR